jgi:hypothetical protein
MKRIVTAGTRWVASLALAASVSACGDSPLTIINPGIQSVRIEPGAPVLTSIGDSLNLSLAVLDSKGNSASCTPTWTSHSPDIASVNSLGRITARAAGLALISASCGGAADTARAQVLTQEVRSVAVSEQSFSLALGASKDLYAVAHDAAGYAMRDVRFSWESSDPSIASVDSTGRVAALTGGRANIIASAAGKADTAAVEVTGGANTPPPASAGDFVVYPSPEVEFILGPQLRAGSPANPWSFFDQNQLARGIVHANAFPADPGIVHATGSIAVNPTVSRKKVIGTGTKFTKELKAGQWIYIYNPDPKYDTYSGMGIASIESDTELTLSGDWWEGHAFTGGKLAFSNGTVDMDHLLNAQYYDLGLALYLTYYRTGDPQYLNAARKVVDSWWKSPIAMEGKMSPSYAGSPRAVSLGGLMLRALDGRPEMWPWITLYTRQHLENWVMTRITYNGLYFGVRDGGYMLLYGAWLGRVHPDAAVRQEFQGNTLKAARDYYARLQSSDGGWYWEDSGNTWEQPFMVGLLLEGLIAVHQQSGDPAIRNAILKSVDHQWAFYRKDQTVPERPDLRWRAVPYFIRPNGTSSGETNLEGGWDTNTIREGRQRNSILIHAFGYAYHLTGEAKYRTWGDELFSSTYGKGSGPGADASYGLADFRQKEFSQAYRSAGRYLAWRLSH